MNPELGKGFLTGNQKSIHLIIIEDSRWASQKASCVYLIAFFISCTTSIVSLKPDKYDVHTKSFSDFRKTEKKKKKKKIASQ